MLAWRWRARRGPVLAAGLTVGCVAGAVVTALVGHAVSSGVSGGALNTVLRLRITLHDRGLVAMEAALALAVYLLATLLSGPDDLGRPAPNEVSVHPGRDVQGVGGDGYGVDAGQQGQFPPQDQDLGR